MIKVLLDDAKIVSLPAGGWIKVKIGDAIVGKKGRGNPRGLSEKKEAGCGECRLHILQLEASGLPHTFQKAMADMEEANPILEVNQNSVAFCLQLKALSISEILSADSNELHGDAD